MGIAWAVAHMLIMLRLIVILPLLVPVGPASALIGDNLAAEFALCGTGKRISCVVDGDTFWLHGIKIRIADINTPETSRPSCAAEKKLGQRATRRMIQLLNAAPFELTRQGRDEDRYGRKLRIVKRGGESLGDRMVSEGLAEVWTGRRRNWC